MKPAYNTIIVGGGIAGLVTALELAQQGCRDILVIDKDTPERIGGLARWAFGGMALCGTREQKRMRIIDSPDRLLKDWCQFANFADDDYWPRAWAEYYAQYNKTEVYDYLIKLGASFLPAVNWVERGLFGEGNSVPRYHVLWGTGWHLVTRIHAALTPFIDAGKVTLLSSASVIDFTFTNQQVCGVTVNYDKRLIELAANHVVLACGGINGSLEKVRQHWPHKWAPMPSQLLNGASPLSDGRLHEIIKQQGGQITHADKMWNYAAGINHPQADFNEHGLSLIPCKSALWLNHEGKRIGPMPLVTGFDTNDLCKQVAQQSQPWTWQILNWGIAAKELAVSGSLHNPSIRDKKILQFAKELLFGNQRLVKQLQQECDDFIVAESLPALVDKMNAATEQPYVDLSTITEQVEQFDQQIKYGLQWQNDDQIRRILHCRQWRPDRLRTCKPKPLMTASRLPLIAIRLRLISRKSLGGLQTNLLGQVLNTAGDVMPGLYGVGEAAGFGGGGANGERSLEGTFLSGCILTARQTGRSIASLEQS